MTEFIDLNGVPLESEEEILTGENILDVEPHTVTIDDRPLSSIQQAIELEQFLLKYSQGLPLHELPRATGFVDFLITSFSVSDPLASTYFSSFFYIISLPLLERKSNERLLKESQDDINKFVNKLLLLWVVLPPSLISTFLNFLIQFINPIDLKLSPDLYLEEDIPEEKPEEEEENEEELDEEKLRQKRLSKYKKEEKKTKRTVKYWRILDNNYLIKLLYSNGRFLSSFSARLTALIHELKYVQGGSQEDDEEKKREREREERELEREREDLTLYGLPPSYIATLPSSSAGATSASIPPPQAPEIPSEALTTTVINENLKLMINFLLYFTSFSTFAYKFFLNNFISSLFLFLEKEFAYNPRGPRISYIVELIWNIMESFIEFSHEEIKKEQIIEKEKEKPLENYEDSDDEEETAESSAEDEDIYTTDTLIYPPRPPSGSTAAPAPINFNSTVYTSALKLVPYKSSSLRFYLQKLFKKKNLKFSIEKSLQIMAQLFSFYLFYGYKFNDKELRNELLIILIYLSEFPDALSCFSSTSLSFSSTAEPGQAFSSSFSSSSGEKSSLFELILTYTYVEEMHGPFYEKEGGSNTLTYTDSPSSPSSPVSPSSPGSSFPGFFLPFTSLPIAYSRNFSTINDIDLEFKRQIWYLLSNLLKDENDKVEAEDEKDFEKKNCYRMINNSSLFLAIFKYLEYNSSSSSSLIVKKNQEIYNNFTNGNQTTNWKMKSTSLEQQTHAQLVTSSMLPFHLTLKKKREEEAIKEKEEKERLKNEAYEKGNKTKVLGTKALTTTTKKISFDNTFSSSCSILYQSKKKGFIDSLTPSRLREFQVQASLFLVRNGKEFINFFLENNLILSLMNLIVTYFNYLLTSSTPFPEHEQILAHLLTFLLELIVKNPTVISYYLLFSYYIEDDAAFSLFFNEDFSSFYNLLTLNSTSSLTFFQYLLYFFNKLGNNETIRALVLRIITQSFSTLSTLNQYQCQRVLNALQNLSSEEEPQEQTNEENFDFPFLPIFEYQIASFNNIENVIKIFTALSDKLPVQVGLKAGIKINKNIEELSDKDKSNDSISSLSSSFALFSSSFSLPSLLISPFNNEVNLLIISLLDFIHYLVIKNKKLFDIYLYSNGVDLLFNLLENSSYLLRVKVLRVLSDLYSSNVTPISALLPYALNWRSSKTLRTLPQLLCHVWLDEEIKQLETSEGGIHFIGNLSNPTQASNTPASSTPVSHRVSGVISNLFYPFQQHNWPQEPKEELLIGSSPSFGGKGETVGPGGIIKNKNLIKKSTTFSSNTVLLNTNALREDDLIKSSIATTSSSSMMVSRLSSAILASRFLSQSSVPSHLSSKIVEIDSRGILAHLFYLLNLYDRYNINDETNPFKLYESMEENENTNEEEQYKQTQLETDDEIFGDISLTTREKQVLILGRKYLSLKESEWWQKLIVNLNDLNKKKYDKVSKKKEMIVNERIANYQDVISYYQANKVRYNVDTDSNDPYFKPNFETKDDVQIKKENENFYMNHSYLKSDIYLISQRLENSFDASLSSLIEQKLFNYMSIKEQNKDEQAFINKILVKKSQQIKAAWLKRNARLNPPTKRQWNNSKPENKDQEEASVN